MSKINWHRLFGLTLTDFFTNSNYQVELEKELSLKKQYLDVVIIKVTNDGQPLAELPSGLEQLTAHNLLTYKSLHEPLDDWAIEELIGHYTNYRKLVSPSLDQLLPAEQFQLYAVSTRYPQKLLTKKIRVKPIQPGIVDFNWGHRVIRLIILNRIPLTPKNAFWLLFSGEKQGFIYGDQHYHWHYPKEKAVLNQLYELYQQEGVVMPYTMQDFERDFTREHLHLLPPAERLKGLPTAERLKGLPTEERLKGLPAEEIFQNLPPEAKQGLPVETFLKQLAPEVIEAYLLKLKSGKGN
jgi:hypothetical protein